MHSNVVANPPMTFVATLSKLWRTFQFCGEPSCGESSLWRTFLIPLDLAPGHMHTDYGHGIGIAYVMPNHGASTEWQW